MVKEFHEAFSLTVNDKPNFNNPFYGDYLLRQKLIDEEYEELCEAMNTNDVKEIAKEMADLLYVVYGTAVTMGIDLDAVFAEVHKSNMSKLDDDGKPMYNSYGKVVKSDNYRPPNLSDLIDGRKN